jgi:cytochrome c553
MFKIFMLAALASLCGSAALTDSHAGAADGPEAAEAAAKAEDVDLEAAEEIFSRKCRACHGDRAQGVASYPKLSDKEPAYIADRLKTYRAGERIGPNSVLMIQNAKDLSDKDIASLAVYVSSAFD